MEDIQHVGTVLAKKIKVVPVHLCFHCSKTFPSILEMNNHAVSCAERPEFRENYSCYYCDYFVCETNLELKKHVCKNHKQEEEEQRRWRLEYKKQLKLQDEDKGT